MPTTRPPSSRRRYQDYLERRREQLDKRSGGDDRKNKRSRSFRGLFVEFWRLLRGNHRWVGVALATLTLASLLNLLTPAGTKVAIDYIITDAPGPAGLPAWFSRGQSRPAMLLELAGALMLATLVRIGVGLFGRNLTTRLTKRLQSRLRKLAFGHAARLPLHKVQSIKSGGIASLLREDAGGAPELLFSMIYNPWQAIVQLAGTLVVLAWVDWRMLLGALVLIPVVWLTHQTWISRIRPAYRDIRAVRQGVDAHATEAFGGIRVVRAFNREAGEAGRFVRGGHLMIRQEMLTWWWSRVIDIAWAIIIPAASLGVLVYGGREVIAGRMTIGDVMMFTAYLLLLLSPLEVLAVAATNMQTQLAGLDRVLDLLQEPAEFSGRRGGEVVRRESARGRLTLDAVHYAYPGASDDVIGGVSLDVRPGELIALVGPSGAGKTTLCNLVARFDDPSRGAIRLDGRDLREIDVESYRRLLGIVEQDVFLFDGTIAQNIGYARRDATPQELLAAAHAANAMEFIDRLGKGMDTLIGERGVRLSGGQKQRLAIARALLADPLILILDEATSNLDTESERLIQASLARLMRGRTSFVIAHRLSTIRHADRIVVLERGTITEIGSHDELLARDGRYAELVRLQTRGESEPSAPTTPASPTTASTA